MGNARITLCATDPLKNTKVLSNTNLVFGVTKNAKFDDWNVNRLILKNNWHFILGLENNKKEIVMEIENLMGAYGIKQYRVFFFAFEYFKLL